MHISQMSADQLREFRRQAKERLKVLESLPNEPMVGTVVAFVKTYGSPTGTRFHFAAVHTPRGWSVTGRREMTNISWVRLIEFIRSDEGSCEQRAMDSLVRMTIVETIR